MSTPKQPHRGPVTARHAFGTVERLVVSGKPVWEPLEAVPGYLISTDGRLAREVKVRTNKNGTRYARVSLKGVQKTIRL